MGLGQLEYNVDPRLVELAGNGGTVAGLGYIGGAVGGIGKMLYNRTRDAREFEYRKANDARGFEYRKKQIEYRKKQLDLQHKQLQLKEKIAKTDDLQAKKRLRLQAKKLKIEEQSLREQRRLNDENKRIRYEQSAFRLNDPFRAGSYLASHDNYYKQQLPQNGLRRNYSDDDYAKLGSIYTPKKEQKPEKGITINGHLVNPYNGKEMGYFPKPSKVDVLGSLTKRIKQEQTIRKYLDNSAPHYADLNPTEKNRAYNYYTSTGVLPKIKVTENNWFGDDTYGVDVPKPNQLQPMVNAKISNRQKELEKIKKLKQNVATMKEF